MNAETPVMVDLNKMREVVITYANNSHASYHMMEDQVQMFLQAVQDLHGVGVNPYSGCECLRAVEADVLTVAVSGPYWWTTPGLHVGRGEHAPMNGAKIIRMTHTESRWKFSPEGGLESRDRPNGFNEDY